MPWCIANTWTIPSGASQGLASHCSRGPLGARLRAKQYGPGHRGIVEVRSILSISQVADPAIQPRDVVFRQNARINNREPYFALPEFDDTRIVSGLPSFLFVHGHQDLSFAYLGVPHPVHHRDYIYRTPNLLDLPHEVPSDLPPVEETDTEEVMSLKAEIDKWRRDNGYE